MDGERRGRPDPERAHGHAQPALVDRCGCAELELVAGVCWAVASSRQLHALTGDLELAVDTEPTSAGIADSGRAKPHLRVAIAVEAVGRAQVRVAPAVAGAQAARVDRQLHLAPCALVDLEVSVEAVEVAVERGQAPRSSDVKLGR